MKKTLQDQYLLIKEGKGHKDVFIKETKRQFPGLIRNAATYTEVVNVLKTKNIINENVIGLEPINQLEPSKKESFEVAFENFLAEAKKKKIEDEKAELKKPSKQVEEDAEKNFDYEDKKNPDNLIFDQMMKGYYTEMKDPKNEDKTMEQLKAIVIKNLEKNPIYYTEKGQFGVKDLGYTMDAPGLGEPKEPKGKYKSSGYGNLKENKEPINEGILKRIKDKFFNKLVNLSLVDKLAGKIVDKMSPEKKEEFIKKYASNLNEGKVDDIMNKVSSLIDESSLEENEDGDKKNEVVQKVAGVLGKIAGINMMMLGGAPLAGILTYFIPGGILAFGAIAVVNLIVSAIIMKMSQKITGKDPLSEETQIRKVVRSMINEELEEGYDDVFEDKEDDGFDEVWEKFKKDLRKRMGQPESPKNESLNESKIRKVIRESVEKELQEINKLAEYEVFESKLEKIAELIEKKSARLNRLDEDEDLKALTDKKKVKELQKDIKKLEKAKAKIEKALAKKAKSTPKKKEVIDEDEPLDEAELNEIDPKGMEAGAEASGEMAKNFKDIESTVSKIELEEEDEEPTDYRQKSLERVADEAEEMFERLTGRDNAGGNMLDDDALANVLSEFPAYMGEEIEFVEQHLMSKYKIWTKNS